MVPAVLVLAWLLPVINLGDGRSFGTSKICPEGYELIVDAVSGKAECTCSPYHLYWPLDGKCYREWTQGPCQPGFRLTWNADIEQAECQCPAFWSRFAATDRCYEEYTQGPCQKGQLFVQGQCTCTEDMAMHYDSQTQKCFQLYTEGPCSPGKIFQFNYRLRKPECVCKEDHIAWTDGNCYEVNTIGPCNSTQCPEDSPVRCFFDSIDTLRTTCACLPSNSVAQNGKCYQSYNQGPCDYGYWLVYNRTTNEQGQCQFKKNCLRFDNWYSWPEDSMCYKQYSQGPCPLGQLFYLNPETGLASCECKTNWQPYYYPLDGKCYEQNSLGPCPAGQYFTYNLTRNTTECTCFTNFVADVDKGICVEKLTRADCPLGKLVTADPVDGRFKCDCREDMKDHYWTPDGQCYEHFTGGPCETGLLFRLDERTNKPACLPPISRRRKRQFVSSGF